MTSSKITKIVETNAVDKASFMLGIFLNNCFEGAALKITIFGPNGERRLYHNKIGIFKIFDVPLMPKEGKIALDSFCDNSNFSPQIIIIKNQALARILGFIARIIEHFSSFFWPNIKWKTYEPTNLIKKTNTNFCDISIIVPTHNNLKTFNPLWENCLSKCLKEGSEIIIVNHNGTAPKCLELFGQISKAGGKIIDINCQFNFSKLINLGVSHATKRNIIILNDDIEIANYKDLLKLAANSNNEDVGIIGAQLRYPDNRLQHGGIEFSGNSLSFHYGRFSDAEAIMKDPNFSGLKIVPAVTGAVMAFRRDTFNQINGWDEGFSIECNDLDFCLRTREIGLKILIDNSIIFTHYESTTRENSPSKIFNKEINSNLDRFFDKYWNYNNL